VCKDLRQVLGLFALRWSPSHSTLGYRTQLEALTDHRSAATAAAWSTRGTAKILDTAPVIDSVGDFLAARWMTPVGRSRWSASVVPMVSRTLRVTISPPAGTRETDPLAVTVTGSSSPITLTERPRDDPQIRQPDIALAGDILDREATVSVQEGLARTVEWFRGPEQGH
jgi:hypothetical protein